MTKKELVAKIAKEQGLDPKKLERMNMEELHKMDKVVPDAPAASDDDLLGGETSEAPKSGDVSESQDSVSGGEADTVPAAEVSDPAPAESAPVGTPVVAEGPGSMDPEQTETPKSPSEVETEQGQGDSGEDVLPEPPASTVVVREEIELEHIIIGQHPVTGEDVYLDEQ